jgi:hypothetical protein
LEKVKKKEEEEEEEETQGQNDASKSEKLRGVKQKIMEEQRNGLALETIRPLFGTCRPYCCFGFRGVRGGLPLGQFLVCVCVCVCLSVCTGAQREREREREREFLCVFWLFAG